MHWSFIPATLLNSFTTSNNFFSRCLRKKSCHLQIEFYFFPIQMSFISFSYFPWLESPFVECWIEVVQTVIHVLFLIWGRSFHSITIECDVTCGVFVDALYWTERVLEFIKHFFCAYCDDHVGFVLY